MDLFLSKLAPLFVYPLGAAILVLVIVFVALVAGARRMPLVLMAVAVAGLWATSMPLVANWLTGSLESRYPAVAAADLPDADVAIVLGGMIRPGAAGEPDDLSATIDRAVFAARLYRDGKVAHLLVTGGNLPWQTAAVPEANLVRDFLVELGVPADAIAIEADSRNTRENALNVLPIIAANGWSRMLLVTSAAHMPRALATFAAAGIAATPAPTDFQARTPSVESVLDFLPDAGALARTTDTIKEIIGLAAYRWRGWA